MSLPEEEEEISLNTEIIYTVSQLNSEARLLLEERFQRIWITGEISNLSHPASGHLHFSLKDERAQVRCSFFRNYHRQLNFNPENGHYVFLQAEISLYEARAVLPVDCDINASSRQRSLANCFRKIETALGKRGIVCA